MNDYKEIREDLVYMAEYGKINASTITPLLLEAAKVIEQLVKERDALRNELCLRCGEYTEAHNGACNGCRWRAE